MKLNIVSDLHIGAHPHHDKRLIEAVCADSDRSDVLVIPGDLSVGESVLEPLQAFSEAYKHVIWVAGNHYFWGGHIRDSKIWIYNKQNSGEIPENVHFLENCGVTIEGVRFYGGTMWFSHEAAHNGGFSHAAYIKSCMPDFDLIAGFEDEWGYARLNHDFLLNLKHPNPTQPAPGVVVTHHIPHAYGIAPQYAGNALNRFFYCPEAQEVWENLKTWPKLWCFGHTHTPCDFEDNGTRFVCNPVGYLHENTTYSPKIVEVNNG
jgi:predicted phosphodiesterase